MIMYWIVDIYIKQIFQNISNGETYIEDIPLPQKGEILISFIWRYSTRNRKKSYKVFKIIFFQKLFNNQIGEVIDKVKNDGLLLWKR